MNTVAMTRKESAEWRRLRDLARYAPAELPSFVPGDRVEVHGLAGWLPGYEVLDVDAGGLVAVDLREGAEPGNWSRRSGLDPEDVRHATPAPGVERPGYAPGDAVEVWRPAYMDRAAGWYPGGTVRLICPDGEIEVQSPDGWLDYFPSGHVRRPFSNPCGDGPGRPCGAMEPKTDTALPAESHSPALPRAEFEALRLAELSALYGNPDGDESRAAMADFVGHLTAAVYAGPDAPEPAPLTGADNPGILAGEIRGTGARRARLERKVALREEWAAGRRGKAADIEASCKPYRGDIAFFTQPGRIVAREKYFARVESSSDHLKMAAHHDQRAAGLSAQLDSSIFSDDVDATQALRERIAEREAARARVVAYNASARKASKAAGAATVGDLSLLDAKQQGELRLYVESSRKEGAPVFPTYYLAGLSSSIARDKDRIASIEAREKRRLEAVAAGGVLVRNHGNSASVTFAERPERETLAALAAAGFHFSGGSWHGRSASLVGELASLTGGNNP